MPLKPLLLLIENTHVDKYIQINLMLRIFPPQADINGY